MKGKRDFKFTGISGHILGPIYFKAVFFLAKTFQSFFAETFWSFVTQLY